MFSLKKPNSELISKLFEESKTINLSYNEIGRSRAFHVPNGYWENFGEIIIGKGKRIFDEAKRQIQELKNLEIPWVLVGQDNSILKNDLLISLSTRFLGIWTTNITRVIEVIDETDEGNLKFGFVYGTLTNHSMKGEEMFLIEWDKKTDDVVYKIFSFSKPKHILAKIMILFINRLQVRFKKESLIAMKNMISN